MRSALKENFKIRQEVLTLKCNCNSLKMHVALWDKFPTLFVIDITHPLILGPSPLYTWHTEEWFACLGCSVYIQLICIIIICFEVWPLTLALQRNANLGHNAECIEREFSN